VVGQGADWPKTEKILLVVGKESAGCPTQLLQWPLPSPPPPPSRGRRSLRPAAMSPPLPAPRASSSVPVCSTRLAAPARATQSTWTGCKEVYNNCSRTWRTVHARLIPPAGPFPGVRSPRRAVLAVAGAACRVGAFSPSPSLFIRSLFSFWLDFVIHSLGYSGGKVFERECVSSRSAVELPPCGPNASSLCGAFAPTDRGSRG